MEPHCSLFTAPLKTATNLAIKKELADLAGLRHHGLQCWRSGWQPTRPTSNVATRQPLTKRCWPTMPRCNIAKSRPHALRHWQSWCRPWNKVAKSRRILLQCWRRRLLPMSVIAKKAAKRGSTLGETALAKEQRCSLLAGQTAESALAAVRVMVSADLALPKPVLPKDKRCQEDAAANQHRVLDAIRIAPK